ncbi:MAG: SMP-30/gluconolactonase/LRE family protein [Chloroflexi bacterium]|nr:SMP-30/gluconolactonase/LRE family protein [Chloroflexota bacterium]MYF79474.1 SMP-30/gluconolactonase/LRE family protein [Chloroflexota bacterium]MYK60418.1 SMP-30/gluconolactonase/LRE family protein [Chloroflexota bacterium]
MPWTFEDAAPMIGSITEGNCWTGTHMLYSNVALNRIMRLDVKSGLVDVFAENTEGTNGLNYDADGDLYGCAGDGRKVVKFNDDGSFETVVDSVDGLRLNSPNDLAITPSGAIYFSDRVGDANPEVGITYSAIISAEKDDDGNWVCTRRTFDTTQPNGLVFSKDYKTLYVAQSDFRASESRDLRAYPVNDDGSLGDGKIIHDFGPHRGIDGMTLASDGSIVACTGWEISGPGGNVTHFDPDGMIIEQHPVVAQRPTNCTFADGDLYVSSIEGHTLVARDTGLTGYLLYPQ